MAVEACLQGTLGAGNSCCALGANCNTFVSATCSTQGSACQPQ
jgi:hypothetical protein